MTEILLSCISPISRWFFFFSKKQVFFSQLSLKISGVLNLTLSGGAVSGNGYKTVSIKKSKISSLPSGALSEAEAESVAFEDCSVEGFQSGAVSDSVKVDRLVLVRRQIILCTYSISF